MPRMLQPAQDLDLEQKALGARSRHDLRAEDLDRDRAVVLAVAGQVHHGHPATSQLAVDRVAVGYVGRLEDGLITLAGHG